MVKQIYFFGSTKNGFECSPHTSQFDHYYSNEAQGDKLTIRKRGNTVTYVYALNGVYTALTNGRAGSVFGFAITLEGVCFSNPLYILNELSRNMVVKQLIEGRTILEQNQSGQIGFAAFSLHDDAAASYLRKAREKIKKHIENSVATTPLPVEVPDASSTHRIGENLDHKRILRAFYDTGSIDVSKKFNKETEEELRKLLKAEKKEKERLREENERLRALAAKAKATDTPIEEEEVKATDESVSKAQDTDAIKNDFKNEKQGQKKAKEKSEFIIYIAVGIIILTLSVLGVLLFAPDLLGLGNNAGEQDNPSTPEDSVAINRDTTPIENTPPSTDNSKANNTQQARTKSKAHNYFPRKSELYGIYPGTKSSNVGYLNVAEFLNYSAKNKDSVRSRSELFHLIAAYLYSERKNTAITKAYPTLEEFELSIDDTTKNGGNIEKINKYLKEQGAPNEPVPVINTSFWRNTLRALEVVSKPQKK